MNMRVLTLVVKVSVPTKVTGRDIHGGGGFVAVGAEQVPPRFHIIVTEALRVLPLEGNDVRLDVAWVLTQLCHRFLKINRILITEQSVAALPFHPRSGSDVLHAGSGLTHFRPMIFKHGGYEL